MHIRERLNVDHVVILILELQDRAAPEAMQGTWAALPPPGLGSISRGAGGGGVGGVCAAFAPLLPKGKERMAFFPFCYLTWAPHSEFTILPDLHMFTTM